MYRIKSALQRIDGIYEAVRNGLKHPLLFLIRLYWGYQFAITGWGKLNNIEGVTRFFTSLGVPFPEANAVLVGVTELTCGIILIAGFGRGYFSIPLVGVMSVAYLTDDIEALSGVFSDPDAFVEALPFNYLLANLLVIAFGPGAISVDGIISAFRSKRDVHRPDPAIART